MPAPNGDERVTPPGCTESAASQAANNPRRRAARQEENWLPPGWLVEDRVRATGVRAGAIDKYYIDPVSGRRFRSRKEVQSYLENGTLPNKRKGMGSDAEKDAQGSRQKTLSFDFLNVPEKINWVLADASADSWTAFIGDDKVPESVSQEWAAAFTTLTSRNNGQQLF